MEPETDAKASPLPFHRDFGPSCGNIEAVIPDLIELGLDVLHSVQPLAMSIESLSEQFMTDEWIL